MSRPAWGGWIEMGLFGLGIKSPRPAPHGAGGLKYFPHYDQPVQPGPAPHGAGGLKYAHAGRDPAKGPDPAPHGAGGLKSPVTGVRCSGLKTEGRFFCLDSWFIDLYSQ